MLTPLHVDMIRTTYRNLSLAEDYRDRFKNPRTVAEFLLKVYESFFNVTIGDVIYRRISPDA